MDIIFQGSLNIAENYLGETEGYNGIKPFDLTTIMHI